MKRHKHNWVETGVCIYTNPLQYEEKCYCGKIRYRKDEKIKTKKLTEAEFKRKYPQFFT